MQSLLSSCALSAKLALQGGILFLLTAILSTGCVSKELHQAEKTRGLNFQRLLAQEEKRADTLSAKLAQKAKEIDELTAQLKETKDQITSLESKNRDLTVELNALKGQSRHQPEQEPVPDATVLSQDSAPSGDKPLSEPSPSAPSLKSEEEPLNTLGPQPK